MAVKGVILDFGDTLVGYPLHTVSGQLEFIAKFAAEFFCRYPEIPQPKIPLEQFARELNVELSSGQTVALIERLSTERLLGSNLQLPQAEAFEREILNEVFKGARLLPDAKQFVQSARSAGYKLGIMSNLPWGSSATIWNEEFSRHGFGPDNIDAVVCCVDVGFRKPRPEGILKIVKDWSFSPSEVAFIGDNQVADMKAAAGAGCHGIFLDRLDYGAPQDAVYSTAKNLAQAFDLLSGRFAD